MPAPPTAAIFPRARSSRARTRLPSMYASRTIANARVSRARARASVSERGERVKTRALAGIIQSGANGRVGFSSSGVLAGTRSSALGGRAIVLGARVGARARADGRRRSAATNTASAGKGSGESASSEEIEKCLEDEECKFETVATLEKTLASVDSGDGKAVDGPVSKMTKVTEKPKPFVNAKTID